MDSAPKPLVEGDVPHEGDLLIFDATLGGWKPITMDALFGGATKIGIYTLPEEDGEDGDVLTTNGAGVLSWTTPA